MNRAFELAGRAIGLNEGEQKAALQDYLTTGGQNLDPATTAWCAAFVNSTLQQAGMQGTGKLNARSYLDWGQAVDAPERGDIAVFSRGDPSGWQGHVGFFDGYNEDGTIRVLGGNQGNAVSIASYSPNALLGFRRAEGEVGNALANTYTPASEGRDAEGNALNAFDPAACATTQSDSAVCAGTADAARAHADALLIDGGPMSKRTGLVLLDKRAAGCHP